MFGWAIYYLILVWIIFAITVHFLWRNRELVHLYKSTRFINWTMIPASIINCLTYSIESIYIFLSIPYSFIAPVITYRIIAILEGGILTILFIVLIRLYGHHWLNRRKFGRNQFFGPYLTYGSDPTSTMTLHWGNGFGSSKKIPENRKIMQGLEPNNLSPSIESIQMNSFVQYIKLNNLIPDRLYYYQIPDKPQIYSFHTSPFLEGINDIEFEFVVVSDFHGSGATITKSVSLIKQFQNRIPFIISCGDNVSDSRLRIHWRTFWKQMEPISPFIPFESAPGNHEDHLKSFADNWEKIFQFPYPEPNLGFHFSFTYMNTAFFFLDSYNKGDQMRVPKEEQKIWLIRELEHLPAVIVNRFLIIHNSIYTTGDFGCDSDIARLLLDVIDTYHIQVVISGHSHLFEAFYRPDLNSPIGVAFITTGGGGGRLDYTILKRFSGTPYKWKSDTHIAKDHPYLDGDKKNPFRNDEAVLKYQEIGKLTHEIMHIKIKNQQISLRAYEWDGNLLYERIIGKDSNDLSQ
jgi:acid phosphatase type 7